MIERIENNNEFKNLEIERLKILNNLIKKLIIRACYFEVGLCLLQIADILIAKFYPTFNPIGMRIFFNVNLIVIISFGLITATLAYKFHKK